MTLAIAGLIATMFTASTGPSSAGTTETIGALTASICVVVSPRLVDRFRWTEVVLPEARAIWAAFDVTIRLVPAADESCDRNVLVRSDEEALPNERSRDRALGWVPFVEGRARRVIFVRAQRILALSSETADLRPLAAIVAGKLAGRVLAHEIGHILLNSMGHEREGLMRHRYRAHDVVAFSAQAYRLSPPELARLRDGLSDLARLAEPQLPR